jgi:ABC-type transport system involved in multi-copper enzyme maturation permease subunit
MKLQILKYEFKKIFCKKSVLISFLVLTFYLATMLFFNIRNTPYITYVNADGTDIKGIKAIKLLKNKKMTWNGPLTEERIKKILEKNHAINSESKYASIKNADSNTKLSNSDAQLSDMRRSENQEFNDIRDLICCSYSDFRSYDYYLMDKLDANSANKFYSNRISQLKTWLKSQEADQLSASKKTYLIHSAETLNTPFDYSYADGWSTALEYSAAVIYALAFVICILMAPIFSVEYQTGAAAIVLSTEHGKKKAIIYKLIAGLLSITLVYFVFMFIANLPIFLMFGVEGGNCPLQAYMGGWKSFYHITNSQAFGMVVLLGYLACLFIGTLSMFLSSKVKNSFFTIILIFLIMMVPAILDKSIGVQGILQKILSVMPHQLLMGWRLIIAFTLYDIHGKVFTPYQILPILYSLITVILLPLTYLAFRRYKIE